MPHTNGPGLSVSLRRRISVALDFLVRPEGAGPRELIRGPAGVFHLLWRAPEEL